MPLKVHMVAICGAGMGSLAGLLQEAGHEVRGSDRAFYPPMSEQLRTWGIPAMEGFDPAHLDPEPDLVVVGNACRKDNPEAMEAMRRGLRVVSFPQILSEMFITGRQSVVVAGTHGKTSTTSLLSFLLVQAGQEPSFLVGGVPLNFGRSFRLGKGRVFVVEGDEYDSAFFDKRPKFLHYQPDIAVLTSLEFDHADIYADMDAYRGAFSALLSLLPSDGLLVACSDDPEVRSLVSRAACKVISYGFGEEASWRAVDVGGNHLGESFQLQVDGKLQAEITLPLLGRHNIANAVAALAVSHKLGLDPIHAGRLLVGFRGVARRMQVRGIVSGVTVMDDFAHHPTEVQQTISAVRRRYPGSQLVAVFEPRTNTSRRKVFQRQYAESFSGADRVVIVPPFEAVKIPAHERFDSEALVRDLRRRGQDSVHLEDADRVVEHLVKTLPSESVVLVMSNGSFDNIHQKLLHALEQRAWEKS